MAGGGPSAETWTAEFARELQQAVDGIFDDLAGDRLKGLRFSLTIADPSLQDCPLIGCSEGFTELCGYAMEDIIGRNCRFLVDPVPKDKVSANVRTIAREFSYAARDKREYKVPDHLRESYMPQAQGEISDYGVFLFQINARKDGSLFRNMFYLRTVNLNDKPYIVGLQTEVIGEMSAYHEACALLDQNMIAVEKLFASKFWLQCGMRRQEELEDDGYTPIKPTPAESAEAKKGLKKPWTAEQGDQLQLAIDKVFGTTGDGLKGLHFSLTLADPFLPQCPLIGCSTGFKTLCGYEMHEIVGRNCRFLVDPVPKDMVSDKVRILARRFCDCVRDASEFRMNNNEQEPWMLQARASDDGVFCAQMNARKDGSLFENMFYMRRVELDDHPYIIGLQTGLPPGSLKKDGTVKGSTTALDACTEACKLLDLNMAEVERVLAGMFWMTTPMRRQEDKEDDGFVPDPKPNGFVKEVKPMSLKDLEVPPEAADAEDPIPMRAPRKPAKGPAGWFACCCSSSAATREMEA